MIQAPEYIKNIRPYQPGKPIEETKREFGIRGKISKLASNENPLGPSPKAKAAARKAIKETHRYPDSGGYKLKRAISKKFKISPEQIVLGNGSNENINFLIKAFTKPGDSVLTSKAAFIAYKISAQTQNVKCLETELREDFTFDLKAMKSLISSDPSIRLVFLPNPNNPTGTYVSESDIKDFLEFTKEKNLLVVLDCAYQEYIRAKDCPDPISFLPKYSHLVVLRTFSKLYGLAGFRVGFSLSHPEIATQLQKVRDPFNTNHVAMEAAVAALSDEGFKKKAISLNEEGKKKWIHFFKKNEIRYLPTQGNFILVHTSRFSCTGPELFDLCLKKGVILRAVANYGLQDWIRISIGTAQENKHAMLVLGKMLS